MLGITSRTQLLPVVSHCVESGKTFLQALHLCGSTDGPPVPALYREDIVARKEQQEKSEDKALQKSKKHAPSQKEIIRTGAILLSVRGPLYYAK